MPDMRYAAGMDGGGTKTVLEARAPDGRVLPRERFGPLNLNSAAAQAVRETMQGCTDALARLPGGRFQPFGIGQRFRRHVETGFFG